MMCGGKKNVVPTYVISKADAKDLAGVSKDLDSASTTILGITVTENGSSRQDAIKRVRVATDFLRGGAYLQIKSMLNGYENQAISSAADLSEKITSTKVEMGYQQERVKSLEDLYRRFPSGARASGQVVDPKDSCAKCLSLATQIITANNDINYSKETLARLQKRL